MKQDQKDDIFDLETDEIAEVAEDFSPTGCDSGIKRFEDGSSNTLKAYQDAKAGTADWEDPEFGADDTSLSWGSAGFGESGIRKGLKWTRPKDMGQGLPKTPKLWGNLNKPVPNGVRQAGLGDCWFLAAVSAIAEEP